MKIRKTMSIYDLKWHVLGNQMWDKQVEKLLMILGQGHELWEKKISKINPEIKAFVIRQYFNR